MNLFDHRWTWRAAERAGLVPRRGHPHAYLDDMLWDIIMNAITMPGGDTPDIGSDDAHCRGVEIGSSGMQDLQGEDREGGPPSRA